MFFRFSPNSKSTPIKKMGFQIWWRRLLINGGISPDLVPASTGKTGKSTNEYLKRTKESFMMRGRPWITSSESTGKSLSTVLTSIITYCGSSISCWKIVSIATSKYSSKWASTMEWKAIMDLTRKNSHLICISPSWARDNPWEKKHPRKAQQKK